MKPKKGSIITKSGEPDTKINPTEIEWIVNVNTSLDSINNAKVLDNLTAGLELTEIKVYNLTVGYDGALSQGSQITDKTFTEFPVDLGNIDSAYQIVYKTKITEDLETFINTANLTGDKVNESDKGKVEVKYGDLIKKFDGTPDKDLNASKFTWKMEVNTALTIINGAKVKDIIKEGLILNEDSIKIYELNVTDDGNTKGNEVSFGHTYDKTTKELVIDLKDIKTAYLIEYETEIDYSSDVKYGKLYEFFNTARLTETQDGKDVEIDDSTSKAQTKRGEVLRKDGKASIKPNSKVIDWTIFVNEAEDLLTDIWIEDMSGSGLEFIEESIVVKDKNDKDLIKGTDYNVEVPGDDGRDFKVIILGETKQSYKVLYQTKITNLDQTKFDNAARISWTKGDGSGNGQGSGERDYINIEKEDVPAEIVNRFSKTANNNRVDYESQTISYDLYAGFYKGVTTDFVITDTFENDGMVFVENSVSIYHRVGGVDTKLKLDVDYTVTKTMETIDGVAKNRGFVITFIDKDFENSELLINYKTSIDPNDSELIVNDSGKYDNLANFKGSTEYDGKTTKINQNRAGSVTIRKDAMDKGEKQGQLDRESRKISWQVYTNYMKKDYTGEEFKVTDTLSKGMTFDKDSLVVKTYTVDAEGNKNITDTVVSEDTYVITENENGFTVDFTGGINERYVLLFNTKIEGISKENYKNTAQLNDGNRLEKTVKYPNHNDFLLKKATNTEGEYVYIDDSIIWQLDINESLSEIVAGATVTDTIGDGLVLVNNSVEIKGSKTLVENTDYTVETKSIENNQTQLTITFLKEITEKYTVKYETVVVTKTGPIKNTAKFNGKEVVGNVESEKEFTIGQSSGGTGTGRAKKGSIVINKVDTKTPAKPITAEAEFEVYYMLNDGKRLVEDQTFKTVNGRIEIYDLAFRDYFIKEVTAPAGFEIDENQLPIKVTVDRKAELDNSGAYKIDIKNENIKINITANKVWEDGDSLDRPDIKLQLLRNEKAFGDQITLADGQLSYTWSDLDKTDNAGVDYKYTVKEELKNYSEDYPYLTPTYSEDKLTVTNTYQSPKTEVSVTKVWKGGFESDYEVDMQLFRDGEPLEDKVVTLEGKEPTTHKWEGLDKTDKQGVPYKYTVKEVNGPRNYYANTKEVADGEFEITNIYVPPTTSVLGKKVWVGGPELKPDVTLQLMRDGEAFRNPVTLTDGEDYYLWTGLDDTSGYKYTVKEVNVPENYKATYSEDGRTVTNTYIVPKTDITGSKVWVGGPSVKPTVELQLYKDGEKHLEPVLLENNKTSYTWKSLDKTDLDGNEFTYTIKEVNTPKDYKDTYSEDGLTVTNTYVSEKIDVTGSKEWIGGPDVKPTIQLQLYRNNNAYLDPVTLVNGNLEHTWKDLDYKDSNGEMYAYTISEVEVPEDYDAYISEDGLTVTNVHFSSEGEYDPNGSKPLVPPTGINNNQLFYLSTLTLGGLGLIALRRKREKEFN